MVALQMCVQSSLVSYVFIVFDFIKLGLGIE